MQRSVVDASEDSVGSGDIKRADSTGDVLAEFGRAANANVYAEGEVRKLA